MAQAVANYLPSGAGGGEKRWKERKWKKDFFSGHTGIKKTFLIETSSEEKPWKECATDSMNEVGRIGGGGGCQRGNGSKKRRR